MIPYTIQQYHHGYSVMSYVTGGITVPDTIYSLNHITSALHFQVLGILILNLGTWNKIKKKQFQKF